MSQNILGILAIGLLAFVILALFFWPKRSRPVRALHSIDGVQEIHIEILKDTFKPDNILVDASSPVRLVFHRGKEAPWCTGRLHLMAFGKKLFLDPEASVSVEITPGSPGTYKFTCFSQRHKGRVVAT